MKLAIITDDGEIINAVSDIQDYFSHGFVGAIGKSDIMEAIKIRIGGLLPECQRCTRTLWPGITATLRSQGKVADICVPCDNEMDTEAALLEQRKVAPGCCAIHPTESYCCNGHSKTHHLAMVSETSVVAAWPFGSEKRCHIWCAPGDPCHAESAL